MVQMEKKKEKEKRRGFLRTFRGNLIVLFAGGLDHSGDHSLQDRGKGGRRVVLEEHSEEGQTLDLQSRARVLLGKRGRNLLGKKGSLGLKTSVEDKHELLEDGETHQLGLL